MRVKKQGITTVSLQRRKENKGSLCSRHLDENNITLQNGSKGTFVLQRGPIPSTYLSFRINTALMLDS